MNIKAQLLKPISLSTVTIPMFDGEYQVKRLTTARLNQHEKEVKKHTETQDGEKLNTAAAQLVLDSILDEKEQPLSETVKPSELMEIHSPLAINAAMRQIIQVNYLGQDAEDTAKKG